MSQLRNHSCSGHVAQSSGAAVAALKARAVAWECPVTEDQDRLSLYLWGCELRLVPQDAGFRLDLFAPEARLLGNMQDSASEVMAEIGLSVAWDRVDLGALASGLSLMRLEWVRAVSPGFMRVRLRGPDAARFWGESLHFRLLLPPEGRVPQWPRIAASGRAVWPDGADALHRPVYTVAAQGGDWIDFDIFRHEGSPTCDWATRARIGAEVGVMGPGGSGCPEARRLCLFGDQTALPAIRRMLDLARGAVTACVDAQACDLVGLSGDARVRRCPDLLAGLADLRIAPGDYVWFAGHADLARKARADLLARGVAKGDFMAAGYWG